MSVLDTKGRKQLPKKPDHEHQPVQLGCNKINQSLWDFVREESFGTFASSHEILGVAEDKMAQLKIAVRRGNAQEIQYALMDVATVCVFGEICITEGMVDWPKNPHANAA